MSERTEPTVGQTLAGVAIFAFATGVGLALALALALVLLPVWGIVS